MASCSSAGSGRLTSLSSTAFSANRQDDQALEGFREVHQGRLGEQLVDRLLASIRPLQLPPSDRPPPTSPYTPRLDRCCRAPESIRQRPRLPHQLDLGQQRPGDLHQCRRPEDQPLEPQHLGRLLQYVLQLPRALDLDTHLNLDWLLPPSTDIVDIKPTNMEELTEVITAAEFHPQSCNLFMYSSSKGTIKLADMREAALCDAHAKRTFAHPSRLLDSALTSTHFALLRL